MKPATVHEIKKALASVDPDRMAVIIMRLAKYKKENKELLTYLLFEEDDEDAYISAVKSEMERLFEAGNFSSVFIAKKVLRKILRFTDKFTRYSGNKETEVDLRICFCEKVKEYNLPLGRSKVLTNMYNRQLKKIKTAMTKLHEDVQYEYAERFKNIN